MKNKAGTRAYTLFGFKIGTASRSRGSDLYTNMKPAVHELPKPAACYHLFTSVPRIPAAAMLLFTPYVNHKTHVYVCVVQVPRQGNAAGKKACE